MKIFIVLIVVLFATGCSTTKIVEVNSEAKPYYDEKLPHRIAIDGRNVADSKVVAKPNYISMTAFYGKALTDAIVNSQKEVYKSVISFDDKASTDRYDYIVSITNKIEPYCTWMSCDFTSITNVDLKDKTNKLVFSTYSPDKFEWHQPGGASFLNFLTGLTLFTTSPILMPLSVSVSGEELKSQISDSNDRVAQEITKRITNYFRTGENSSSKDDLSIKLEKIKTLFEKGFISKEDYESKKEEILRTL